MPLTLSRRHLLATAPLVGMVTALPRSAAAQPASALATAGGSGVDPTYPTRTDAEAREMVGVSHFNLARLGVYCFGVVESETLTVAVGRFGLTIERSGTAARGLSHVGQRAFFPAGAPAARIRFTPTTGTASARRQAHSSAGRPIRLKPAFC